jgi:hypothetical protein
MANWKIVPARLFAVLGLGDLIVGRSEHIADDLPIIRWSSTTRCACSCSLHPPLDNDRECERFDPNPSAVHHTVAATYET